MSSILHFTYLKDTSVRRTRGRNLFRGFSPFAVTDIILTHQTYGWSYDQPYPFQGQYPVLYLGGLFDRDGYYTAAGLSYSVDGSLVDEFILDHEFRAYINGPLQPPGVYERMEVFSPNDSQFPSLFSTEPFFQDIPVIPGFTFNIQISVYNNARDQEGPRTLFTFNCPPLEKPPNLQVVSVPDRAELRWDFPDAWPGAGGIAGGPVTWKVTANGVEMDRNAGGSSPGIAFQLLTGELNPDTQYELIVTPLFEDIFGNIYEYESASLNTEIPAAPDNFAAVVVDQDVDFTWDAVPGADGYNAYLDAGEGYEKQNETLITTNSYEIDGLPASTYDAFVVAVKNNVESAPSNVEEFEVEGAGFTSTYSLLLNGSTQYVDSGANTVSQFLDSFTIETWIKTTRISGDAIFSVVGASSLLTIQLLINMNEGYNTDAGNVLLWIRDDSNNQIRVAFQTPPGVNDGEWRHIAFVRTGAATFKLYFDGADLTPAYSNRDNTTEFPNFDRSPYIGANHTGTTNRHLGGNIFEFRFWSDARSQSEIQANKNQSLVPVTDFATDYPDLKMYYNMVNGSGDTLTDATGNFNGTLNGNVSNNMWEEVTP